MATSLKNPMMRDAIWFLAYHGKDRKRRKKKKKRRKKSK